jgi:hypothetical protein
MSGSTALEAPVLPSVAADPVQPGRLVGRLHAFPSAPAVGLAGLVSDVGRRGTPVAGLETGQAGDRDPAGAPCPDTPRPPGYGPTAPMLWLRRSQGLTRLVLEADPRAPAPPLAFYRGPPVSSPANSRSDCARPACSSIADETAAIQFRAMSISRTIR